MTGIEVAKKIRSWNKELPLIGLSAHIDENKDTCLQAGMAKVLSKPLSVELALKMLAEFVHH